MPPKHKWHTTKHSIRWTGKRERVRERAKKKLSSKFQQCQLIETFDRWSNFQLDSYYVLLHTILSFLSLLLAYFALHFDFDLAATAWLFLCFAHQCLLTTHVLSLSTRPNNRLQSQLKFVACSTVDFILRAQTLLEMCVRWTVNWCNLNWICFGSLLVNRLTHVHVGATKTKTITKQMFENSGVWFSLLFSLEGVEILKRQKWFCSVSSYELEWKEDHTFSSGAAK